jgi:hypothetical protein
MEGLGSIVNVIASPNAGLLQLSQSLTTLEELMLFSLFCKHSFIRYTLYYSSLDYLLPIHPVDSCKRLNWGGRGPGDDSYKRLGWPTS